MSLKFICFSLLLLLNVYSSRTLEMTFKIDEEMPINTFVGDLSEYLSDKQKGFKFEFALKDDNNAKLFHIDEASGRLFTAKRIDRDQEEWCEDFECELDMKLLLLSSTNEYVTAGQLKIIVIDINDNAPYFESAMVSKEIDESLSVKSIILVNGAHDIDAGVNTVKTYELLNGQDQFSVRIVDNGIFGGLVLEKQLDREKKDFYNLTLIAKDNGVPQSQGSVIISLKVKDVNDNKPLFTEESYDVDVYENVPISSTILTLSAKDADTDQNGFVGYRFYYNVRSSIKKIFSIKENSGEIMLKKNIDYEKKSKYSFKVVGFDHGSQPQSSIVSVNINVLNVNDNKPDIYILHVSDNVSESDKIGDTIAHISVSDIDDDEKSPVDCTLDNSYFKLDSDFKRILINKQLDFEETQTHNVDIICNDHGEPQLQSNRSFLVRVHDENDNPPVFRNPLIFSQLENHEFKAFIVHAEDRDSGINSIIHYQLLNDSESSLFNISLDGLIMTDEVFDREQNPELEFKVLAIDKGTPPLTGTGTVILSILDVNDETPTFGEENYEFHVKERQDASTIFGKVEAQDLDINENGQLDYWIPNDNESSEYFKIDQGNLITKRTFIYAPNLRYDFEVFASDRGKPSLSSWTNVTVFVDDINDNYPYFVFPTYNNNSISIIYKMTSTNKPIAKINALDEDDGDNAKLSYFLETSPESPDIFRVNDSSGEIMLVKNRKFKAQKEPIKLSIIVRDHGYPTLQNTSVLFVRVDFGNHSWSLNKIDDLQVDEANKLIGHILGIVTAFLVVCVIVIICIVRKIDDNRRHYPAKKIEDVAMKKSSTRSQCSQISLNMKKNPHNTDACSPRVRNRMGSENSECGEEVKEIDECLKNEQTEKKDNSFCQISTQGGSCAALL